MQDVLFYTVLIIDIFCRYSGLRKEDYNDLVDRLTAQYSVEIGPARERPSSIRHENWVYSAGGAVRGLAENKEGQVWVSSIYHSIPLHHLLLFSALNLKERCKLIRRGKSCKGSGSVKIFAKKQQRTNG